MRVLLIDDSSQITKAVYDREHNVLTITFVSGDEYSYYGVSALDFGKLACAKSAGSCFNSIIKNKYQFSKRS